MEVGSRPSDLGEKGAGKMNPGTDTRVRTAAGRDGSAGTAGRRVSVGERRDSCKASNRKFILN